MYLREGDNYMFFTSGVIIISILSVLLVGRLIGDEFEL